MRKKNKNRFGLNWNKVKHFACLKSKKGSLQMKSRLLMRAKNEIFLKKKKFFYV